MNITTYIENSEQLDSAVKEKLTEVILCHKDLCRFGKLDTKSLNHLAALSKEKGLKVFLEFDIIKTQDEFQDLIDIFNSCDQELIDEVRVQDIGILNWILENTSFKVQLNLEGSNHNLKGIKEWQNICGQRLSRLILSIELSKDTIASYIKELSTPIEILGLGRILLFYTPRSLLSSLLPEDDEMKTKQLTSTEFLEASGESEESPHKGFPLVENRHGTFMFHIKRLNLLKHIEEFKEMGLAFLRMDFRFDELSTMQGILENSANDYPYDSIKGFFNINKSDVLFKKLKNYRIQRKDESYVGEILEISSKSFLALKVKKTSVKVGQEILFFTPDGKEKIFPVKSLRDSALNSVDEIGEGSIAILTYLAGVGVKSQAYLKE